jgi:DNA-binding NtrC family response regulator
MTGALSVREVSRRADLPPLLGSSSAIRFARMRIEQFAKTNLPVLLVGPTGSGKELLAQHLHRSSSRSGELVDVNCGALPREMIESLLFGHRRGAFSGAIETTLGLILRANRGTLFLDELSSLPAEGQAKLLRVLETGEVLPLGDSSKRLSDFRLVGAVQEDIDARVSNGLFRRDLFHRVAGVRITLPALSGRREDIPLLATYFASTHGCTITPGALALVQRTEWPGNVRELRTAIERAAIVAGKSVLEMEDVAECLNLGIEAPAGSVPAEPLLRVCRAHRGQATLIAAELGISRATLFRRLKASGISLASLKVSRPLETHLKQSRLPQSRLQSNS